MESPPTLRRATGSALALLLLNPDGKSGQDRLHLPMAGVVDFSFESEIVSRWSTFWGGVAVLLMAGCGGGDCCNGDVATVDKAIASGVVIDGNGQSATVNTQLSKTLVVRILNKAGNPVSGQVVNFKVVRGGGSVFAGAATSDGDGLARERWTIGTSAEDPQELEVRAVDANGAPLVLATFYAVAVAGAPAVIFNLSGRDQRAQQTQALPSPIGFLIEDAYGNRVSGASIAISVDSGGTVLPTLATTDSNGTVSVSWTLGPSLGAQTLTAACAGLQSLSVLAYADRAAPGAVVTVAMAAGDMQTVVQHAYLPASLVVRVIDVLGNGVPGVQVTLRPAPGSPYFRSETVATSPSGSPQDVGGEAKWRGYLHTAGEQRIEATVAGLDPVTFTVNVMPSAHRYDGRYSCTLYRPAGATSQNLILNIEDGWVSGVVDNGRTTPPPPQSILDESTGALTIMGFKTRIDEETNMVGILSIDALNRAAGSGTTVVTYGGPLPSGSGSWTCERL